MSKVIIEDADVEIRKQDGYLPLWYRDPVEKDTFWLCDYDQNKNITSIFLGHGEKLCQYLRDLDHVKEQEERVREIGWVKCKLPDINVTFDAPQSQPSRKERRKMERQKKKK